MSKTNVLFTFAPFAMTLDPSFGINNAVVKEDRGKGNDNSKRIIHRESPFLYQFLYPVPFPLHLRTFHESAKSAYVI